MARFRKKPVEIEAIQWTGYNLDTVSEFTGINFCNVGMDGSLVINTLEGDMKASKDDWIIKGVKGEFYPCKPDIFEQTYELVV